MTSRRATVSDGRARRGVFLAGALVAMGCGGAEGEPTDSTGDGGPTYGDAGQDMLITTIDGAAGDCNQVDACMSVFVEAKLDADSCEFSLEDVMWSKGREPYLINLRARIGSDGEPALLFRLDSCTSGPGWAFNDPSAPTKIVLCPDTCARVRAPGSLVEWAFGCPPIYRPPPGCPL